MELQLGDKRPSHLLQEMRQIAGNLVGEDFLKNLWIRQLPASLQTVVSASGEQVSVLAVLADRVNEVTGVRMETHSIATTSQPEPTISSQMADLQRQIAALTTQFQQFHSRDRSDGGGSRGKRNRSQSRGRSTSRSRSSDNGMCWYHRRFNSKATRCTRPCSYKAAEN